MTPVTIDHGRLAAISHLDEGGHDETDNRMCVMEAAAWVAHEPWSDRPACVCPVLAAYARALNDRLPDGQRQRLIPLIPAMIGTAGDGHDVWRMYRCADWTVRVAAPRALDAAGLGEHAERLRALAPVVDQTAVAAARAAVAAAAWEATAWDDAIALLAELSAGPGEVG